MIGTLFLALAAVAAPLPPAIVDLPGSDAQRFEACTALVKSAPDRALEQAGQWVDKSGTVPARECLGLAFAALQRWTPAAAAFERAGDAARLDGDARAGTLWIQGANAALAAADPAKARTMIDNALGLPSLAPLMRGEAWLDRARADVALNDLPTARYDVDQGLKFASADGYAWLLSATLARRQKDLDRAGKDIEQAARLAPDDPGVALEAGNIAASTGATDAAVTAWKRAISLAPDSPEGKAAAAALSSGDAPGR